MVKGFLVKFNKLFLVLFLVLSLSSCSNLQNQSDTLNSNLGFEPQSLDWHLASDSYSFDVISNLMVGLTRYRDDSSSGPGMASHWEVSADAREFIFHLVDAKWTDGVPLVAQHFVDAFVRLLDPKTGAPYADLLSMIDLNETKALDDKTLIIQLKYPAAYFIGLTSYGLMLPIRKDLIEKYGDDWTEPENLVTNGPYTLKEWQHEYKILLERNDDFALSPAKIKYLKFFMVPEQSSAFTLFENGQFDWIDGRSIPNSEVRNIRARKDVLMAPLLRNTYIGFNTLKKPFDNKLVRRAFSYAMNREIFPKVLGKGEVPNATWIPPGLPEFFDASKGLDYKPELARQFLNQAGFAVKIKNKKIDLPGKAFPEVEFLYPSTESAKLLAETAQSLWKEELGIEVKLIAMEWKVFLDNLQRDPPHLFRLNWGADYPDPDTFMQLFTSTNPINHGKWTNLEYDILVDKAAAITDNKTRKALYRKAEKILTTDDMAIAPIFINTQILLKKDNIKGLSVNPMDTVFLDKVSKGISQN